MIVIGLGGNVPGEPAIRARFVYARAALASLGEVRSAPLYRSAPIALPDAPAQPAFLNSAVGLRAEVLPRELIETLHELERLLGRTRELETRWGPRPIDLDVLVWGDRIVNIEGLEVPHPRLGERRFALLPLIALLGEAFVVPGQGVAGELLRRVADQEVTELGDW